MVRDGQITWTEYDHGFGPGNKEDHHDQVLVGFAGSVADAVTLFNKFEGKLEEFRESRAAVEVAREWSGDKYRRLEALLVVMKRMKYFCSPAAARLLDRMTMLAIGSGGPTRWRQRALLKHTDLDA